MSNHKEQINIPDHVVIIPDGNRRWARERGLEPWKGREAGAENTEKLMKKALEMGVKCFSLWGSSQDNLKNRPLAEKQALLRIYEEYFKKLLEGKDIHENEVRVNFIGQWEEQFPQSLKNIMYSCIEATKNYSKRVLNFFLAYNGDEEMLYAIKKIAEKKIMPESISFQTIKENLMTKDLPAVDFMIRTGGEPHLSAGFMMWDTANSQLYFSEKFFPDFDEKEFEKALMDFSERERRLGK